MRSENNRVKLHTNSLMVICQMSQNNSFKLVYLKQKDLKKARVNYWMNERVGHISVEVRHFVRTRLRAGTSGCARPSHH